MFSFGKFLRRTFVVCALILSVQARESLQHKRAIHLTKTGIDCKILFLNTSPTIGTELYDEFRNKKSPFPAAIAQNQTTKLPLSISFNQTTVAEMQLAEDLRHAGRGEPPVR